MVRARADMELFVADDAETVLPIKRLTARVVLGYAEPQDIVAAIARMCEGPLDQRRRHAGTVMLRKNVYTP